MWLMTAKGNLINLAVATDVMAMSSESGSDPRWYVRAFFGDRDTGSLIQTVADEAEAKKIVCDIRDNLISDGKFMRIVAVAPKGGETS